MYKFILPVFTLAFAASTASATDFGLNVGSPAQVIAAGAPAPVAPVLKSEKARKASLVQVSGYISLSGNAWMPQNGGYTSVNLNGWGTFRDAAGKVSSNNTYVTAYAGLWLQPNQYVFQSVHPSVTVQFYRGGRPVGSATLNGYINVSGWPGSTGMVMLNGSGQLSGSLYVEDEE